MILQGSNLTIRFGQTIALNGADVAISPGEIVAIMDRPDRASRPCCTCSPESSAPSTARYA